MPKIKYYRGRCGKNNLNVSITINKKPEISEKTLNITAKEKKEIFEYVKLNYKQLLKIWNKGNRLYKDELDKIVKKLKKINN